MNQEIDLSRSKLTTPRAAAIAGILFSVLLIISLALIRISVPANPQDTGDWLTTGLIGSGLYTFGRATTYEIMNIYTMKRRACS